MLRTYDPASEISRVNATIGTLPCSQELLDVLAGYDWWNAKSGGAYNGHLGDLIRVWRAAEQAGAMPDAALLQRTVAALRVPAWKIDPAAKTVSRTTAQPLNVDSLGKGYIISKAAAVARAKAPQGFLLNIGGDIFASGRSWKVGVANPKSSADNSPPLTEVNLKDLAISTSAAYERGYIFGGWCSPKPAPCGSRSTAMRPASPMLIGGTHAVAPSAVAFAKAVSRSATAT